MGLILVFDVDGTLGPVDGEPGPGQGSIPINPKILEVIREGVAGRGKGPGKTTVDALFILSNNSDTGYMRRIEARIQELLGIAQPIFDDIMARGDFRRDIHYEDFYLEEGLPVHNPRKSLADVATMIESINATSGFFKRKKISLRNLAKRIYFFDDLDDHVIRGEIHNTHYIHINPSYTGSRRYKDSTKYYSLMSEIRGNKRTTRKL